MMREIRKNQTKQGSVCDEQLVKYCDGGRTYVSVLTSPVSVVNFILSDFLIVYQH